MTPDGFFAFAKKHQADMVDLKFVDMLGSWQHCSFPIDHLDANTFKEGLGFDGSSIRGWMGIHESDMLAVPDPDTTRLDPFFARFPSIKRPHRGLQHQPRRRVGGSVHVSRAADDFLGLGFQHFRWILQRHLSQPVRLGQEEQEERQGNGDARQRRQSRFRL